MRSTLVFPAPLGSGERQALPRGDLEAHVERDVAELRAGVDREAHAAAGRTSFTARSSAAEMATSTAESASADVKSVEKRS